MSRRISAIMPIYNEEEILKACLDNLMPYVDELVVIDGGPFGESTDKSKDIVMSYKNVIYQSGTFKTIPGAWDITTQKNIAVTEATGDVFLLISADMAYQNLDVFRTIIEDNPDIKIFYCPTIEFWLNTKHIRLYEPLGNLSIPSGINQAFAIDKTLQPIFGEHGKLDIINAKPTEHLLVMNMVKYHFGWIRSFPQQVNKHIRHVRQGAWGEKGKELLNSTEQKLEQWAILHVLSYTQVPNIVVNVDLPESFGGFMNMTYTKNQEDVINSYKKKYGSSPFRGVEV